MIFWLKKEDKINLLIKNIKRKRKSKKFNYIKVKLFLIKTRKKVVNYKLKLFKAFKIYFIVIETSKLKNNYIKYILLLI